MIDFRNEKVTAPLKQNLTKDKQTTISGDFRNEKVTAPLKHPKYHHKKYCSIISVTKKLRPH